MKRRQVIKGVAAGGLVSAGAVAARPSTDGLDIDRTTHVAIRQDDGTYDVVPKDSGVEPDCFVACKADCCYECTCDCCECRNCFP